MHMSIIVLLIATLMMIAWFILLNMAESEDWIVEAYNKIFDNLIAIKKMKVKDKEKKQKLTKYHGVALKVMSFLNGGNSIKKIDKLERQNEQLQNGNLKSIGLITIPGYVLIRKFDVIGHSTIHNKILTKTLEIYGKKHFANKTKRILAQLLSYPIIGISIVITLGTIAMGSGDITAGIVVIVIGTLLVLMLAYAIYDEIDNQAKRRQEAIVRQFPNMVSKLALLVTSGMIMDKAWRETAYSQDSELYIEMQKTSEELDNLVSPKMAYSDFIHRCNTKETAKLSSAIIQNLSKGNAEIGNLLKEMAREAWMERRHTAKRESEKANSKLMIPTMLLFLAILVMIMVPVAISFSGL